MSTPQQPVQSPTLHCRKAAISKITQEEVKKLFYYDCYTGALIWLIDVSNKVCAGDIAGCKSTRHGNQYLQVRIRGVQYKAHRIIWLFLHGYFPEEVDHINGNGFDNRICNLRAVTKQENGKNQRLRIDSISGCNGVYWKRSSNSWHAQITVNSKKIHLGYFKDLTEAVKERKSADIKYGFHENHGSLRPQS